MVNSKSKKVDDIIICDCQDVDHHIILRYVEDGNKEYWDSVYLNVHLKTGGFFKRLKIAWKYLIKGSTSPYGEYDEIILPPNQETIDKLENAANYLKSIKKTNTKNNLL